VQGRNTSSDSETATMTTCLMTEQNPGHHSVPLLYDIIQTTHNGDCDIEICPKLKCQRETSNFNVGKTI